MCSLGVLSLSPTISLSLSRREREKVFYEDACNPTSWHARTRSAHAHSTHPPHVAGTLVRTRANTNRFPYTIRLESLITESCGSSSMGSVCAGSPSPPRIAPRASALSASVTLSRYLCVPQSLPCLLFSLAPYFLSPSPSLPPSPPCLFSHVLSLSLSFLSHFVSLIFSLFVNFSRSVYFSRCLSRAGKGAEKEKGQGGE